MPARVAMKRRTHWLVSCGDDDGYRLPVPVHAVVLQDGQVARGARIAVADGDQRRRLHARRVAVGDHGDHPRCGVGGGGVDTADPAARNRAADQRHGALHEAHRAPRNPSISPSTLTTVRRTSSILNWVVREAARGRELGIDRETQLLERGRCLPQPLLRLCRAPRLVRHAAERQPDIRDGGAARRHRRRHADKGEGVAGSVAHLAVAGAARRVSGGSSTDVISSPACRSVSRCAVRRALSLDVQHPSPQVGASHAYRRLVFRCCLSALPMTFERRFSSSCARSSCCRSRKASSPCSFR